jgi:hypothetical protein
VGRVERSRAATAAGSVVFAFHPHQDRFVVDAADAVPLGTVDPRLGTLVPLIETALQVALDAGEVLEQRVVVVGLGAVGILTAALLVRAGARVIAAEPRPWRREAAAAFGFAAVPPDELPRTVTAKTDGAGVPLVVEVTGNPAALAAALPLLAHEGTALVASWYGVRSVTLPLGGEFHRRRLTIRSTQVSTIPARLAATWTRHQRLAAACRLLDELPVSVLARMYFLSKTPRPPMPPSIAASQGCCTPPCATARAMNSAVHEVGTIRPVRAFHVMPGVPGPEGKLHAHDYRVEVVVERPKLDNRAMVCDLDVLNAALTRRSPKSMARTSSRSGRQAQKRSRLRYSPVGYTPASLTQCARRAGPCLRCGYGNPPTPLVATARRSDQVHASQRYTRS